MYEHTSPRPFRFSHLRSTRLLLRRSSLQILCIHPFIFNSRLRLSALLVDGIQRTYGMVDGIQVHKVITVSESRGEQVKESQ
jgi:hypothetical protein